MAIDTEQASTYLQYLPSPFHTDPFMGRFLRIFENILGPIERTIDNVSYYFDPRLAPEAMLPWLAAWVGLELDENWPVAQQRQLVLWAVRLNRCRGTRRALHEHLRLYTGHLPLIAENVDQQWIKVILECVCPGEEHDEQILRHIIELEKPAHVGYTLEVRRPSTPERTA